MPSTVVTPSLPTVLIVDDQPENLSVIGELLQTDYRVRIANSGMRALAVAASEPRPDLILLDVMMPGMDGHEVMRLLLADPATRDIPVIFVTAMDREEDEERGFLLGAVDYITKPIKPAVVRARVHTHIRLQLAETALRRQNADLEAEVVKRTRETQIVQDVAMRALASLAEARDNETGNHILRTQGYVEILAKTLAADPRYVALRRPGVIDLLVKAAPLHDIGKVGIPDNILTKPGPLSPDEWVIMQTHTSIGADAIEHAFQGEEHRSPLGFLHIAMDIAAHHHEKWAGNGYPFQLKGEAIPLAARLMALADVFDALISRRVYKPPMPLEKASAIIRDGRGSHFDPAIVDAFVARTDDFRAVANRYGDDGDKLS